MGVESELFGTFLFSVRREACGRGTVARILDVRLVVVGGVWFSLGSTGTSVLPTVSGLSAEGRGTGRLHCVVCKRLVNRCSRLLFMPFKVDLAFEMVGGSFGGWAVMWDKL